MGKRIIFLALALLPAWSYGDRVVAAKEIRQERHDFRPTATRPVSADGFVIGDFAPLKALRHPGMSKPTFPLAVKVGTDGLSLAGLALPQSDKEVAPKTGVGDPDPADRPSPPSNLDCLLAVAQFDLGSARLTRAAIEKIATALRECDIQPPTPLRVVGYTCDLGIETRNAALAQARAEAVAQHLRDRGYTVSEVVGSRELLFQEPSRRHLNRRVEIQIKKEES